MEEVKYPDITVKLVGKDGNAFAILGRCSRAMREAGIPKTEIDRFIEEATSGNYDNLLVTCTKWFNVE